MRHVRSRTPEVVGDPFRWSNKYSCQRARRRTSPYRAMARLSTCRARHRSGSTRVRSCGSPTGTRGADRRASAGVYRGASLTRRHTDRARHQRSGQRYLGMGPGPTHPDAADVRRRQRCRTGLDAGRPTHHFQLRPAGRSKSVRAGRRRNRRRRALDDRPEPQYPTSIARTARAGRVEVTATGPDIMLFAR